MDFLTDLTLKVPVWGSSADLYFRAVSVPPWRRFFCAIIPVNLVSAQALSFESGWLNLDRSGTVVRNSKFHITNN